MSINFNDDDLKDLSEAYKLGIEFQDWSTKRREELQRIDQKTSISAPKPRSNYTQTHKRRMQHAHKRKK